MAFVPPVAVSGVFHSLQRYAPCLRKPPKPYSERYRRPVEPLASDQQRGNYSDEELNGEEYSHDNKQSNGGDSKNNDKLPKEARVFRGASGQELSFRGDALPFDLKIISPPPRVLGRFMLNPRTNCGDVIEHEAKSYVVKRVRCHYRLERNGPTMFKKTVEIKSLARKSIESYLERTLRES